MMQHALRSTTLALVASGALALAACSKERDAAKPAGSGESAESVAAKVAAANVTPRAGRWEVETQVKSIDVPGMPPQVAEAMKQQMGKVNKLATCLTPEEAAKPRSFFTPGNDDCTYQNFSMEGGRIQAAVTCKTGGMSQAMTMTGTYAEEAYAMTIDTKGEAQGKPMAMSMAVSSKRVGDCRGDETG